MFQEAIDHDPTRALNLGIMEQTMVGVAAGFAMEGFHPVVHTITPFLAERAFEQLKVDFGYQGIGGLFISVGASYDYAESGATHHAPGDAAELSQIPGMEILVPGHAGEVERLIHATYDNGRPTYLRTTLSENVEGREIEFGTIEVVRRGDGATVVAVGPMLDRTLAATEDLDVSVLYLTTVEPFDAETLLAVCGDEPTVISVEPFYEGTLTPAISRNLARLPSRIASIGVPRKFISCYGSAEELDGLLGLDSTGIRERITRFVPS
jgi:transketolase